MTRKPASKLDPDAVGRQTAAIQIAFAALGDGPRVMAFLNTHEPALGGRPIDLALAGPTGLALVRQFVAARHGGKDDADAPRTIGKGTRDGQVTEEER